MFYRTAYTIYNNGNCNYKHSQLMEKAQLCELECLIQHTTVSLWDGEEMSSSAWEWHRFRVGAVIAAHRGNPSAPRQGMETTSKPNIIIAIRAAELQVMS